MLDKIQNIKKEKRMRFGFLKWRKGAGLERFLTSSVKHSVFYRAVDRTLKR